MARLNIVLRLRLVAVVAPIVLLLAGLAIAGAFYLLGGLAKSIYEHEFAALNAGQAMENALYKMDWGRSRPDGRQIVEDQQRRFVDAIGTARDRATSREQLDQIAKIATTANPLFGALRKAQPGDDTLEPQVRDLESMVVDLISADEASMMALGDQTDSEAWNMIIVTVFAAILIPWICFVVLARMTAALNAKLREIRGQLENLKERDHKLGPSVDAIDNALTALGYPKPNPMLAE